MEWVFDDEVREGNAFFGSSEPTLCFTALAVLFLFRLA
jgi:hypothetical protein